MHSEEASDPSEEAIGTSSGVAGGEVDNGAALSWEA